MVMKKVPYDIIQKLEKSIEKSYLKFLKILNEFVCALKRENYLHNFT